MANEEFNLSEKRKQNESWKPKETFSFYWESDVKEFIKKLKEELRSNTLEAEYNGTNFALKDVKKMHNFIDKLAGDKLNKEQKENDR